MLKHADENDKEDKKEAIDYLENAIKERDAFIAKTMTLFADAVTKEQLMTAIRESYFRSYALRLKISGKQATAVKESAPIEELPPQ